jgi:peptidyl-prolyl cis-trans isomerase A (cyclophilin A)
MTALTLGGLALLTLAMAQAAQEPAPEPTPTPPTGPRVVIETSVGTIKVALDEVKAPKTVANFLAYVAARQYDGTIFHRVIPGFMVQAGGMTPDMNEKPTQAPIRNEASNGLRNSRGTLAMARTSDPDSATAQFFINTNDNHRLDYGIGGAGYAVFGMVIEGMEVIDKIEAVTTTTRAQHQNVPVTAITITRVFVAK